MIQNIFTTVLCLVAFLSVGRGRGGQRERCIRSVSVGGVVENERDNLILN